MTLDVLDPLVARRPAGRLRPGPGWRRWTLQRLQRRRCAADLAAWRERAAEAGDADLVAALEPVVVEVRHLAEVEPDDDDPLPEQATPPHPKRRPRWR